MAAIFGQHQSDPDRPGLAFSAYTDPLFTDRGASQRTDGALIVRLPPIGKIEQVVFNAATLMSLQTPIPPAPHPFPLLLTISLILLC